MKEKVKFVRAENTTTEGRIYSRELFNKYFKKSNPYEIEPQQFNEVNPSIVFAPYIPKKEKQPYNWKDGWKKHVIIIGNGSIGKRHAKNLEELGYITRTIDIDEIEDIDHILEYEKSSSMGGVSFGMVCTPTHLHLDHCIKLAEHGIDFFCEKPLFAKYDQNKMDYLKQLCYEKSLINMVACNLRFSSSVKNIPLNYIENSSYIKVKFGYDLRKWHNDGKHLQSYSANRNQGGGVIMDCIHEFDYLYHWYGNMIDVQMIGKKTSDVTVDTEDYASGYILFENGKRVFIELDYLSENYTRFVEFDKKYKYDIVPNNEMYIDELKYFLYCLEKKQRTFNDIEDAEYLINKINNGTKYD